MTNLVQCQGVIVAPAFHRELRTALDDLDGERAFTLNLSDQLRHDRVVLAATAALPVMAETAELHVLDERATLFKLMQCPRLCDHVSQICLDVRFSEVPRQINVAGILQLVSPISASIRRVLVRQSFKKVGG